MNGTREEISHHFFKVLQSLRSNTPAFSLRSFFTLNDDDRTEEAEAMGLQLLMNQGILVPNMIWLIVVIGYDRHPCYPYIAARLFYTIHRIEVS